jgi:hypothetical protein
MKMIHNDVEKVFQLLLFALQRINFTFNFLKIWY